LSLHITSGFECTPQLTIAPESRTVGHRMSVILFLLSSFAFASDLEDVVERVGDATSMSTARVESTSYRQLEGDDTSMPMSDHVVRDVVSGVEFVVSTPGGFTPDGRWVSVPGMPTLREGDTMTLLLGPNSQLVEYFVLGVDPDTGREVALDRLRKPVTAEQTGPVPPTALVSRAAAHGGSYQMGDLEARPRPIVLDWSELRSTLALRLNLSTGVESP